MDKIIEGEVVNVPLTEEEQAEHNRRVQLITEDLQVVGTTFLRVWDNLGWIQHNKTYRVQYNSFQEFCREELGKDNATIYRYIKDAKFKEQLLLQAGSDEERLSIIQLKESNSRFIRTLPEEAQQPFWSLAYTVAQAVLTKKQDGSVEPTTSFFEQVGDRLDELLTNGGMTVDGQFLPVSTIDKAAEVAGVEPTTARSLFLAAGLSEDHFETLQRQQQHIRDKSTTKDIVSVKGMIEVRIDTEGNPFPILVDSKGNETDLVDTLLSYRNRHVTFTLTSPLR